jgi:coenzyme F420 hydrogenase subunit beta
MSKRLEMEVWSLNNCTGCGMCVASCSKQVLGWDNADHPVLEERTKVVGYTEGPLDSCTFCQKFCEEICPRLERWAALEPKMTLAARACGPVEAGTPNDVIRSILTAGRSAGLLDGVVMLDLDPWELKPVVRIASTVEEIVDSVGPQYLWAPILDALNEAIYQRGMENLAVVGTPCVAQAIRSLKASSNIYLQRYQNAIRLTISVFCTGLYRPNLVDEIIINQMGISRNQVKRLEASPDGEQIYVTLWDNTEHAIPRQRAEEYTRSGCASCDDYLGESADLSVGTVGAPDEHSTLIIRTRAGDIFVRNATQMNLLKTNFDVDISQLEAVAEEKDRRERAQAFKDLKILMLDALADPLKRSQAIKQFILLYRTPASASPPERISHSCTGC